MSNVLYQGDVIKLETTESVLDALIRSDREVNYGCKSGVCQTCIAKISGYQGDLSVAQKGLTSAQIKLDYALCCQLKGKDLADNVETVISTIDDIELRIPGEIVSVKQLNQHVAELKISSAITYIPGQYAVLWNKHNIGRAYSFASHPKEDAQHIFHIKKIPHGIFSSWVFDEAKPGEKIEIQGPMGDCVYTADANKQSMLLAAVGTGLAPLMGILRDALLQSHSSEMHLLLAANSTSDFYLLDELRELSEKNHTLKIHLVSRHDQQDDIIQSDVYDYVSEHFSDLNDWKVFLCGNASFVQKMRKKCFLAGTRMQDISSDTFFPFGH